MNQHTEDQHPDDLVDRLLQLAMELTAVVSQIASAHDLSLTQVRLLAILRDREPRMADLADHLGLDRSSISGLVDRASRNALVRRIPDPDDRRSTRVALTDEGRAFAAALTAEVQARAARYTAGLVPGDRADLQRLLDVMLASSATRTPKEPALSAG